MVGGGIARACGCIRRGARAGAHDLDDERCAFRRRAALRERCANRRAPRGRGQCGRSHAPPCARLRRVRSQPVCARENLEDRSGNPESGRLRERLWKIRARAIVSRRRAPFERPMLFPDNDRPGVMLAGAAQKYAARFGVACGRRAVIAANSDSRLPDGRVFGGRRDRRRCDRRSPGTCRPRRPGRGAEGRARLRVGEHRAGRRRPRGRGLYRAERRAPCAGRARRAMPS